MDHPINSRHSLSAVWGCLVHSVAIQRWLPRNWARNLGGAGSTAGGCDLNGMVLVVRITLLGRYWTHAEGRGLIGRSTDVEPSPDSPRMAFSRVVCSCSCILRTNQRAWSEPGQWCLAILEASRQNICCIWPRFAETRTGGRLYLTAARYIPLCGDWLLVRLWAACVRVV